MTKGDRVLVRVRGREQWEHAMVVIVSENQKSVALALDHLVPGLPVHGIHPEYGAMIMLLDKNDGEGYRDLASGAPCEVKPMVVN